MLRRYFKPISLFRSLLPSQHFSATPAGPKNSTSSEEQKIDWREADEKELQLHNIHKYYSVKHYLKL